MHIAFAHAHAEKKKMQNEKHWMMLNSFVPICHVSLSWLPLTFQHSIERSSPHFCHYYHVKHKSWERSWKWAFFEFEASFSAFCCGLQVWFFWPDFTILLLIFWFASWFQWKWHKRPAEANILQNQSCKVSHLLSLIVS